MFRVPQHQHQLRGGKQGLQEPQMSGKYFASVYPVSSTLEAEWLATVLAWTVAGPAMKPISVHIWNNLPGSVDFSSLTSFVRTVKIADLMST